MKFGSKEIRVGIWIVIEHENVVHIALCNYTSIIYNSVQNAHKATNYQMIHFFLSPNSSFQFPVNLNEIGKDEICSHTRYDFQSNDISESFLVLRIERAQYPFGTQTRWSDAQLLRTFKLKYPKLCIQNFIIRSRWDADDTI